MRSPNSGHIAAIQRTVLGERAARRLSMVKALSLANARVQLQAQYNRCGEAASEKCLSAATFVRRHARLRIGTVKGRE